MKILIICPHLKVGGVPRYVLNLAKGHKSLGHDVTVASYGGVWQKELDDSNIEFLKIPLNTKSIMSFKIWKSLKIILKHINENKIDIVHANTRVAQYLAFLIRFFNTTKYISTYHGYYKAHLFRRLFRFEGNSVIAISKEIKKHATEDLKVNENKITVVYNGIDTNEYRVNNTQGQLRKKYSISAGPVVGIVARLVIEKNHQLLIKAFKLLQKDFSNAKLVIFGKGRQSDSLKELVNVLDLKADTFFIEDGNVKEIFSCLDVAVLPSTHEGFGFTIIEAQALKVPVVGSAIGGIKEVIQDGETGLIFNKFDESILCDKIAEILNNDKARKIMVNNAFKRVNDKFSLNKMSSDTISVYKKVLEV